MYTKCDASSAQPMNDDYFTIEQYTWCMYLKENKFFTVHCKWLKTVDTIDNCQRQVFSHGVSQHMHKKNQSENLRSIGRRSCKIIIKEKTPLSH